MPLDADKAKTLRSSSEPCRKSCIKKYKKPSLRRYRGETFIEKVDACISAHYVCCKPEVNIDTQHPDIRARCIEEISQEREDDNEE